MFFLGLPFSFFPFFFGLVCRDFLFFPELFCFLGLLRRGFTFLFRFCQSVSAIGWLNELKAGTRFFRWR